MSKENNMTVLAIGIFAVKAFFLQQAHAYTASEKCVTPPWLHTLDSFGLDLYFQSLLMNTRSNLKADTIESVEQWLESDGQGVSHDEINDEFYQIIDSSIPVYNADLLDIVGSNLWLWAVTPEIELPKDESNPFNIIKLNIYEALKEAIRAWYYKEWKNRKAH